MPMASYSPPTRLQGLLQVMERWPRDTRDTLFMLTVIAWVLLPQVSHLPLWCSLTAAAVLLWRAALTLTGRPLPRRWWLLLVLGLALAATLLTYRTVLGRDAGVTLTVVLLTLKTLELRARRDAFVVFFLSFFTLVTTFFYSQSLLTAAAMLLALLGLLTALVNAHLPVGKPPLLQSARIAGGMALLGAPIMALLFMLFPRIGPLWGLPADAMSGRSGLSATMEVGNVAQLALDSSIAMRVRFDGPVPPASNLYFRGPVLSTFDGRAWRPLISGFPLGMQLGADLQVRGAAVRYEVTLEPSRQPWLLLLEASPEAPALSALRAGMTTELQWLTDRPVMDLLRYRAQAYTDFRHGPMRPLAGLQYYLTLPPGFNPRTLALAAQMLRQPELREGDGARLVAAVLQRLRNGGYTYTLSPGLSGQHSADEFWFDGRKGFCEHIASSFVVLMRAMDVPARVVTGYQGGERNDVDGFWVVRQRDAHAWAEVWLAGRGWVRVDPTAAVAPGRIDTLERLEAPENAMTTALTAVSPQLRRTLRTLWDATNNQWNQWVLNYGQERQLNLLRNLGFKAPSWETASYLLIAIAVLTSLLGAAWTLWDGHRQDPWLRLLARATERLTKRGVRLPPQCTPREMARLTLAQLGDSNAFALAMGDWLLRLEAQRYAPPTAACERLVTLSRDLQRIPQPT